MGSYGIKNSKLFPPENNQGELITYKLSDEELKKYRSGDKERATMAENKYQELKKKYPDLESLIKATEGKSIVHWAKENNVPAYYFNKLKTEYESQVKELKLTDLGHTPEDAKKLIDDINKQDTENPKETNQELEYADLYVIYDGVEFHEFNSLDDALLHIKTQNTLLTVGNISLFKEIPFTMNVNVTVGKCE